MSTFKPLKVAIVGTGIFARDSHLPSLKSQPELFEVYSCFNRTKAKAEIFAEKAGIPSERIYNSLEEVFQDENVDLVDALLPVQFNLEAVKLASKYNKNIFLEKPIAATLDQAKEILKIVESNSNFKLTILEHWCYFKSIEIIQKNLSKIGKIYSFTYSSTGQFNFNNKYLATSWRTKPEHVGGFLSDGGVHQLALLTGALGEIKSVCAKTRQIRELSGADDLAYTLMETDNGAIGTFTYGSSFGFTDKKNFIQILGDNGSIYYDFSPKSSDTIIVKTGGLNANDELITNEIKIEDEYRSTFREFQVIGNSIKNNNFDGILSTPKVTFHHLAIVDAIVKSSENNGQPTDVFKI